MTIMRVDPDFLKYVREMQKTNFLIDSDRKATKMIFNELTLKNKKKPKRFLI